MKYQNKKRFNKFSILLAAVSSIAILTPNDVHAIDYPLHCGSDYEISRVKDDGSFEKIACYGDFYSAKDSLKKQGDDAVMRHYKSFSPSKIIGMNSGIAYTYPYRSYSGNKAASTMNISKYIEGGGKTTYANQHREMTGIITETYNGSGEGRVYVNLMGFTGYANLRQMDLVPMKYIENKIPITLGGKDVSPQNEQPFTITPRKDHYEVIQNGKYKDLVFHSYSGFDSQRSSFAVGKAPDWMSAGDIYYSPNNYDFYKDIKTTEYAGTYYNYYQFLPLRSKSNIPADAFNRFLNNKGYDSKPQNGYNGLRRNESKLVGEGQTFIDAQNEYGMNALMIYSMACLESGYGRSRIAVNNNNLFGWNAFDSDPSQATKFPELKQAITEHMAINIRGYTDITDFRFFGSFVGNKGSGFNVKYASDPYWGAKIASIAYEIDKSANNYDGNLTDFDNYTMCLVTEYEAKIKEKPDGNSRTLYNTGYGDGYQNNYIAIMLGEENGFEKIQSTNGIDSNGKLITHRDNGLSYGGKVNGPIPYSFDKSVGYLPLSQIKQLNNFETHKPGFEPEGEFISKIDDLSLYGNTVLIQGTAYQPGIYLEGENAEIKHQLVFEKDGEEKVFDLSNVSSGIIHYDNANFLSTIDLTSLDEGVYNLKLRTIHKLYSNDIVIKALKDGISNQNGFRYTLSNKGDSAKLKIEKIQSEEKFINTLKGIELTDDGILKINGVSFVKGMDNTKENTSHKLVVVDLNQEKITNRYDLNIANGDYNMSDVYNDGFNYEAAWYSGEVNINDVKEGNYILLIETQTGEKINVTKLYGNSDMKTNVAKGEDGLFRELVMKYGYSYRVELSVHKYELNKKHKEDLPRIREGYQNLISVKYDEENNDLIFNGTALIYNGSFKKEDNPKYTLFALNKDNGGVFFYEANGEELLGGEKAPWNNTERLNSGFNYDNTWYSIGLDIDEMSNGHYEFMLKIETDKYIEYIDLMKLNDSGLDNIDNEKVKFDLSTNQKDKQKVELNLEKRA